MRGGHSWLREEDKARMERLTKNLVRLSASALALVPAAAVHAQASSAVPSASTASPATGGGPANKSSLTANVTSRYESNVARIDDPVLLAQRGLERSDVRVSPSLQLDVARAVGRHLVGLRSYLGYDFYARNTQLNRERLLIEPYLYLNLPVCDVNVDAAVGRRLSELGDVVVIGPDPTAGIDNTETSKRIVGRLTCGDSYGLRPTFEVERASGDNSNPVRRISDYRITRIQPGVGYASPGFGEISLYAVRTDTDLPNQFLPDGRMSGFTQRGFGASYRRAIGTRLNFNGSISHVEVTPYGGDQGSRSGLNGSVALTLLASERLQFTAFANRSFTSTLTSNATYELQQGYGLTANYAVNDRLRLRLGGSHAPRRLFYAVTPAGAFIERQTQTDIFAGLTYNLNRRMRVTLDGGYQRRDADLNVFDYDGYYAAAGISISL